MRKVVSCLSTCIFPDKTTYPIDETMVRGVPRQGGAWPGGGAEKQRVLCSPRFTTGRRTAAILATLTPRG